jgi:hypothetical protein
MIDLYQAVVLALLQLLTELLPVSSLHNLYSLLSRRDGLNNVSPLIWPSVCCWDLPIAGPGMQRTNTISGWLSPC